MAATFGKRSTQVAAPPVRAPVAGPLFAPQPVADASPAAIGLPTVRFPLVTTGILVLLAVIYVLELQYAPFHGARGLSARTLAAYGAIEGDLMFSAGEWWRLFTAPLLHASQGHLIGNAIVFGLVGFMLEPLIGPRWFAGLFVIGGLGGALVSIFVNAPDVPSVGASGAIMGVLGAAFICGSSARSGPKGRRMQTWALRLIIPALIPLGANSHVDFACHLGGVLSGITAGVLLLMSWTRGEDRPAFGGVAAAIGAAGLAFGVLAFVLFARGSNAAVIANGASGLIPESQMPAGYVDSDRARDLLARYPHDPRAHFLRGYAFLKDDHDLADAEEQLREALQTKDLLAAKLTPEFERTVTLMLAITIAYENRPDEARALGAPFCADAARETTGLYDTMRERGICGGP
jgi:rhomboid protease GluP